MDRLERILSRPAAKPYRSKAIKDEGPPHLNADGHVDFKENDIENPKNWSTSRRWYVTTVAIGLVVNATFASSSPSGCLGSISEELHVSEEAAGLVVTIYLLGYCAGPLIFAPLSEFYGRRAIFLPTFTAYFAFNFLCAFTPNFAGLLVGRFLTGTFASAPLSNCPGVLADLWGPIERGNAMALFSVMTFAGPALGPVTGGFLELTENWRWTFYELIWLAFASLLLLVTIPETLPSQVLTNKAKRLRRTKIPGYENVQSPTEASGRTLKGIFWVAVSRPWIILFDPIAFLCAVYLSIVYTLLYMLFSIYPYVFQEKRGWNSGVGELPLIGTVIGALIGGGIVFWNSHSYKKKIVAGHELTPEDRLTIAMIAGILFPATMFWFAWSAEYNSVPWIVPTLAGVFLSTSILLVFVGYLNYLTDSYLMYAASAIAGNTVVRSAAGASAPLFTNYMFDALGAGVGGTIIAAVACLLAPIPFVFYKYGRPIREKSRFAPTGSKEKGQGQAAGQDGQREGDDEEKRVGGDAAAREQAGERRVMSDESEEDERELDEEAGVPDRAELEREIEKERSEEEEAESSKTEGSSGDRFLDADGLEKAEKAH